MHLNQSINKQGLLRDYPSDTVKIIPYLSIKRILFGFGMMLIIFNLKTTISNFRKG